MHTIFHFEIKWNLVTSQNPYFHVVTKREDTLHLHKKQRLNVDTL